MYPTNPKKKTGRQDPTTQKLRNRGGGSSRLGGGPHSRKFQKKIEEGLRRKLGGRKPKVNEGLFET